MTKYAIAIALVAALAAPAVAPASHGGSTPVVFKLKKRVGALTSTVAQQGIRARLARHGFKIRSYRGRCKRLSKTARRCTYKFRDRAGEVLGTGAYCSSKRGTTVRLVRRGRAMSVGGTSTRSC
jgi:hypothetical protein